MLIGYSFSTTNFIEIIMTDFNYINNKLHVESVCLTELAQRVPLPFYCYSTAAILKNYHNFASAVKDLGVTIAYALKANSNLAILKLLSKEGCGADVVSIGELKRALMANIPANKIVFSGVGKTDEEIDFALEANIGCFNVESASELYRIMARAELLGKRAPISLRVNPDVDAQTHHKIATGKAENKFGINLAEALQLYQLAAKSEFLDVVGVDMHIGSQITKAEPFEEAFKLLRDFILLLQQHGIRLKHIDIGGGLGVAYKPTQEVLAVESYAALIKEYIYPLGLPIICEPGRYLVANTGLLVTSVIFNKTGKDKNFMIVDAGMNDLMRPTLYEAWHHLLLVDKAKENDELFTTDVVGPVCETGDYLALSRQLPLLDKGELLAIANTGAYGAVMSNSYNSRPIIAEVLINGDTFDVIRRPIVIEEIMSWEDVPSWLQ